SPWISGMALVGAAFLILNCFLFVVVMQWNKGRIVLTQRITSEDYGKEYLTPPFTIDKADAVVRLSGNAAIRNSWVALDFALVDSNESVLKQFGGDASFYDGVDEGEYWSEGSTWFSTHFRVEKPGVYRLLVYGQGGNGAGQGAKGAVTITVETPVTLPYWFLVPIISAFLVAFYSLLRKSLHERARWE
ncbi:MAG: hypothetical protein V2B18_16530, partial [Pseudomonadota bacterium]